jgi:hypothetical protein
MKKRRIPKIQRLFLLHIEIVKNEYDVSEQESFCMAEAMMGEFLETRG